MAVMEEVQAIGSSIPARLLIAALCVLIVHKFLNSRAKNSKGGALQLPPGPRPWPVIGNLLALGNLPHQDLDKLAKRYGPLMYLRLGSLPCIVVSSPEIAQEVLKTNDKIFASRPNLSSNEIMGYGSQNFGFLPYGEQWRNARALFTTGLTTQKRIEETQYMRKEEIKFMLESIVAASQGGAKPISIYTYFFHLSSNLSTRQLMSKRGFGSTADHIDDRMKQFLVDVNEMGRLFGVFNIGDFIPSLKNFDLQGYRKDMWAVRNKMDVFFHRLLDTRTEELRRGEVDENADLLSVLLGRPKATKGGSPMTTDQIKGMLLDVLFAGSDTITMGLEWTFAELLKHPEVIVKCQKELDEVVGRSRLVQDSDLPNLTYMQAVVKESLRLHPVGTLLVPHFSTEDCTIGGFFVPAGTRTMVNAWAIHRDPAVWDRALEFLPERFIKNNKLEENDEFRWLPFGSGRRGCPGRPVATRIMHIATATVLQCFNWALPPPLTPSSLDMSEKFGLGVSRSVPLDVIVTPRLPLPIILQQNA